MKRLYIFILSLITTLYIKAENISVKIEAPKEVGVNEEFSIKYEIGTTEISNFQAPNFDGFTLLDERRSTSSSTTIINGKTSSQSTTSFIFLLKANAIGSYTISPATIILQGNIYKSRSIPIRVVQSQNSSNSNTRYSNSPTSPPNSSSRPPSITQSTGDLMIKAIASQTKVFEQEVILLTYKIYTNTEVSGFHGKLPVLDGFHIQEIESTNEQSKEIINGKPYITAIWKQYILYPQSTGSFEIPSIECEADIVTIKEQTGPLGMVFRMPVSETRKVSTTPISITVMQLPPSPSSFNGAVGNFSLSSSINKKNFKVGDVISLKVFVRGVGNLKLFDAPEFNFPDAFESYDCKTTDNIDITKDGNSGLKTYEYLAVPREKGNYKIPSLLFTYFDSFTHTYKTLKTPSYDISVSGNGETNDIQLEVDELDKDIKHIKTNDIDIKKDNMSQLYSWKWITAYMIVISLFVLLLIRNKIFHTEPTSAEGKRKLANKNVIKCLKKAKLQLEQNNVSLFYDEMINGIYSYTQNKLNIEKESFNKEYVSKVLEENNVDKETIEDFLKIINRCESARFSQQKYDNDHLALYNDVINIINRIDNIIK